MKLRDLEKFAWDIIDYYTETSESELPKKDSDERVFWYSIWQLQHLCGEGQELDSPLDKEIHLLYHFLNGSEKFPDTFIGERPSYSELANYIDGFEISDTQLSCF